ncbi:unnamed protein product [Musa acuminata subsp. malaccensis]|uniref:(wild Malaysian banana) hypothetical protein n=1 Tax=Musa acuminata subsp. malaccensis TaxID=214687 RepID=A0A804L7D7_MUSAM|nr:unnamed protein product [Musa acuminata subsp. malaccensis]
MLGSSCTLNFVPNVALDSRDSMTFYCQLVFLVEAGIVKKEDDKIHGS